MKSFSFTNLSALSKVIAVFFALIAFTSCEDSDETISYEYPSFFFESEGEQFEFNNVLTYVYYDSYSKSYVASVLHNQSSDIDGLFECYEDQVSCLWTTDDSNYLKEYDQTYVYVSGTAKIKGRYQFAHECIYYPLVVVFDSEITNIELCTDSSYIDSLLYYDLLK